MARRQAPLCKPPPPPTTKSQAAPPLARQPPPPSTPACRTTSRSSASRRSRRRPRSWHPSFLARRLPLQSVLDEERFSAYDWGTDRWTTVAESEWLKGAAEIAVAGGRACVVAHGGTKVLIVDVTSPPKAAAMPWRESSSPATPPPRMWEVAAPSGKRVVLCCLG